MKKTKDKNEIGLELSISQIEMTTSEYLMRTAKDKSYSIETRFNALLELIDRKVNGNNHR
jgi:hypothetical protein